ncbi:MAG: hypothetical protein Q8K36_02430, partial [Alphaproteobacteria bacterium]|nr:hypothetical protein [Alphaproteobacteria bacterium]
MYIFWLLFFSIQFVFGQENEMSDSEPATLAHSFALSDQEEDPVQQQPTMNREGVGDVVQHDSASNPQSPPQQTPHPEQSVQQHSIQHNRNEIFRGVPNHNIMGLDDLDLIIYMMRCAYDQGQKDFYILDLGAGAQYQWVETISQVLTHIQTEAPMNIFVIGVFVTNATLYHNLLNIYSRHPSHPELPIFCFQKNQPTHSGVEPYNQHRVYLTKYISYNLKNFHYKIMLDFPVGIDMIFSEHTLNYVSDPVNTLIRAYNRLRPGGLFLFEQFDLQIAHRTDFLPTVHQREIIPYYRQIDCLLDVLGWECITRHLPSQQYVRNYSVL